MRLEGSEGRHTLTDAFLDELLKKEELDGKFADCDRKQEWKCVVRGWIDLHRYDVKDHPTVDGEVDLPCARHDADGGRGDRGRCCSS
jgi:hypothetical protein